MQPFFERITGAKVETDGEATAGPPTGVATKGESADTTCTDSDSAYCVNTSVLSVSKLIYAEAIQVFYENNVIQFNIPDSVSKLPDSVRLSETDLSLATRVTTKFDLDRMQINSWPDALKNAVFFPSERIPRICPGLHSSTIYIYTDHTGLFSIVQLMRDATYFENVSFEGVGKVAASVKGRLERKVFVHCTRAIERWESQRLPRCSHEDRESARYFYDHSREGCEGRDERLHWARDMCYNLQGEIVPADYPAISDHSHEFWTVMDHILGLSDHDDETPEIDLATLNQMLDLDYDDEDDARRAVALMNELFGGKKGGDDALPEP